MKPATTPEKIRAGLAEIPPHQVVAHPDAAGGVEEPARPDRRPAPAGQAGGYHRAGLRGEQVAALRVRDGARQEPGFRHPDLRQQLPLEPRPGRRGGMRQGRDPLHPGIRGGDRAPHSGEPAAGKADGRGDPSPARGGGFGGLRRSDRRQGSRRGRQPVHPQRRLVSPDHRDHRLRRGRPRVDDPAGGVRHRADSRLGARRRLSPGSGLAGEEPRARLESLDGPLQSRRRRGRSATGWWTVAGRPRSS